MIVTEAAEIVDVGKLANNGTCVRSLQSVLSNSGTDLNLLPKIVQRIVKEEAWREYVMPGNDDVIYRWNPAEFRRFIEAPRAEGGCQTPLHVIERLLTGTDAWSAFLELTRGERGGANNQSPIQDQETGRFTSSVNRDHVTVDGTTEPVATDTSSDDVTPESPPPARQRDYSREAPTGNSVSYAMRRLRNKRADLYEEVKTGKKSANAAMVEAGFRDQQINLPSDPIKAARRLVRHFTPEEFRCLVDEAIRLYAEQMMSQTAQEDRPSPSPGVDAMSPQNCQVFASYSASVIAEVTPGFGKTNNRAVVVAQANDSINSPGINKIIIQPAALSEV